MSRKTVKGYCNHGAARLQYRRSGNAVISNLYDINLFDFSTECRVEGLKG